MKPDPKWFNDTLTLTDESGQYSLEELVGKTDGEEPWTRHIPRSFNADGTATMMCGLTKALGVPANDQPKKWRWCHICKRYA